MKNINEVLVDRVASACCEIFFDKKKYELPEEYNYSHLPICAMDAVFSIGVKYESVTNTINRFCAFYAIDKFSKTIEYSTTFFLDLMQDVPLIYLTENIFNNRQRTSTSNGILKSEALIKFLGVLQLNGIETRKDIDKIMNSSTVENEVKNIPGQRSGISYKYFLMLSGSDNHIKPDRMLLRFLNSLTETNFTLEESQVLIEFVVKKMNLIGFDLTPRKLDNLIWNYQRLR